MKLNKDVIEKIHEHALREYPEECCGIVTGNSDAETVHLCVNIQNRMHAKDPAAYPRDARTAYLIERSEFQDILSSARSKGEDIIAFYHSHPEHEAYFSEEDLAAQTVFGEPEFPDALHVVVSVMDKQIRCTKCFKWQEGTKNFTVLKDCV